LEGLDETNNFRTLIYTGTINQMCSAIWAVDFVAFLGFLVPFAAFFKFRAAITIS
jgi:NO-binding membrane sensor protein with MHYT domain